MSSRWLLCLLLLCTGAASARAEERLTLVRVIELARTRAPDSSIARARTEETRAALVGARRLSTRNPVLEVDVGPRWSDGRSTDAHTSLSLPLELGGRRAKRVAVALAEIEHDRLEAQDVERLTVAAAVTAYYQVLHAEQLLALVEERLRLAEASEVTARQRVRAGDVAELDINLARGEVARAKSSRVTARAGVVRQRARLAGVLGLPGAQVIGELADRKRFEDPATALARPDLRALAQEIEVARTEIAAARAERWPSIDLRVTYEHEREADIVLGGIAIPLPFFERGTGDVARARARGKRAELELATRTALATSQLASARETYAAAVAATEILAQEAVPLSLENEAAAAASYRAGKMDLGTLLIIRREVLDTRREHLDGLLEAALAAVDLWIARGAPSLP